MGRRAVGLVSVTLSSLGFLSAASGHLVTAAAEPCISPTPDPMPAGADHRHADRPAHAFSCGLEAVATLDLLDVVPEPMDFGEIDVAGDRVVVATAYPRAGFVVIDVRDPARPKALGRWTGPAC